MPAISQTAAQFQSPIPRLGLAASLRRHWPEYLTEAAGLGFFMISAAVFTTLIEHPASPLRQMLPYALLRHFLNGTAMGLTLALIVYSPWGKQSGAHLNPVVTGTFLRLGKVKAADAAFYALFQAAGGVAGLALAAWALGGLISDPSVSYVVTRPGPDGPWAAFAAEAVISFCLMLVILTVSNRENLARWTGLFAGGLLVLYITFESPLSGMSMNPSRSFASALLAGSWTDFWIYLTAPPLGMLLAAQFHLTLRGRRGVSCAKLHHQNKKRCIFCGAKAGESGASRNRRPGRTGNPKASLA